MLKFNDNNINGWCHSDSNIIKVYRNDAILYYRVSLNGSQEPCYAVVNDISQYQDTEFVDVFNKADGKWYKLNNLNQYEEYGVYGNSRNITYYDGKLTIDDDYEYQYSGGSWVNVGEVSGSTATLPNVPFSVNYNAKNYDANTKTLAKTLGQLVDVDAVITNAGTPTVGDGYLTITGNTRATISGYATYFNRTNNSPELTIVSKQKTSGSSCHMFANRDGAYNWMYRPYDTKLTLHGTSEKGQLAVSTQPVIESARVNSNRDVIYNNYTNSTTSSASSFSYGSENTGKFAIFAGYGTSTGEWFVGDFYWVYMSQNYLTNEQIQQVIDYNEVGASTIYPVYYTNKQDPPDNVVFSTMEEAEAYECPYVGMHAIIAGDRYVFSESGGTYYWEETRGCFTNFCGIDTQGNAITIDNGTTTLAQNDFSYPYPVDGAVGDATTTIGNYAFQNIKSTLTSLTISNTVTTIGHEAFMETSGLTTLTIPASVASIDFWCFTRCTGLTEVIFEGTTPPSFVGRYGGVFHDYCPPVIYVPDAALSTYRAIPASTWTNKSWSTDIIQPISNRSNN